VACGTGRFGPVLAAPVIESSGSTFPLISSGSPGAGSAAVVHDVARCLRPGRRFVYLGLRPCFVGPFVNRATERQDLTLSSVTG
jgi:hypothetical protein